MEITTERKQQAEMLISFFNAKTSTKHWYNDKNINIVAEALDKADGNLTVVKQFFRDRIDEGQKNLADVCKAFIYGYHKSTEQPVTASVEASAISGADANALNAFNLLGNIVTELLAKTKLDEIQDKVAGTLKEDIKQFIFENYGPIQRKIEFQMPDRKVEFEGVVHSEFETILNFVEDDELVFLTGPAGSGKNVLCQQVAKALGLDFYFSNAVTQEYKITGFTDAMGVFHESQFYKAFKNGGLFMLDEMDASIPEVLIILNAAIANKYFDFPAPIGYVEAHKDFRVIAAGNTFGNGADYDYVGRNQLDAASLNRFAMVKIDYDAKIEEACANGDADLLKFCQKFRKATKKAGIRTVVSYREISRMAKMSNRLSVEKLLETCLIKALDLDDLKAIEKDLDGCGKYTGGFRTVIEMRKAEQW